MTGYDLTKILPHKPPMILIDNILEINLDEHSLKAEFEVNPEKIFYEKGKGINSLVGIEFMAQISDCTIVSIREPIRALIDIPVVL